MDDSPIRQPSGWLPIAMSLTALGLVLFALATHGFEHESDEGTAAHLFQLLMGLQVFIVPYFAVKWLPRSPKRAPVVLALQVAAAMAAFGLLYWAEHAAVR